MTNSMPAPTYRVTVLNIRTGARRELTAMSAEGAEVMRARYSRGRTVVSVTAI